MADVSEPRPTSPMRWSLAVPLLVLAGFFGMHGLGDHTAAHGPLAAAVEVAGHHVHAEGPAPGDAPQAGAALSGPEGVVGLCMAILLGGMVARLLVGSGHRRTAWTLPRQALVPVPAPRSRAPDRPTPLLLSVCRC